MGILDMPNELLQEVAGNLSIKDLSLFRSACRHLSFVLTPHFQKLCLQDVHVGGSSGLTALQWAAIRGLTSLIELAVSKGAEIDEPMRDRLHVGSPAISRACPGDHRFTCHIANNGTRTEAQDSELRTPLFLAACTRHVRAIEALLALGARIKYREGMDTPAHISARLADVDSVRAFMAAGFDLEARGSHGQTILHEATDGPPEMINAILQQAGGTKLLNARDSCGSTPLHAAVYNRGLGAVDLLLRYGADIHAKDNSGDTPAHLAIRLDRDCLEILIAAGVDFEARGRFGQTILHVAVQDHAESVGYLLEKEATKMIINAEDDAGLTPLRLAESYAECELDGTVEMLLQHGAGG